MALIYISAPYSLGDPIENVRKACEAGDKVLAMGHIAFIPHLSMLWHFYSMKSYDEWLRIDCAYLPRMDAVLRLPGKSKGADWECALAKKLGIKVYYNIGDIE
jgi:hypothetical protein